jgi:rhodanese-related sulfurtransferase
MREKITYLLLPLGVILAFLPLRETRSLKGNPENIWMSSIDQKTILTPDQVARMVVREDSTLVLIDLRQADEFRQFTIPGSVNVPYDELVKRDPSTYLGSGDFKNVFFSNSDLKSGYAVVIAAGMGYDNCYSMKGGLNDWFSIVMNSAFTGEKISAAENALFEIRYRAKHMFNEMNSLPDSLKVKYLKSKRFDPKKLDGGCE